ncbi:MAG: dockerin type I domain-containing protein [Phycisphaerales bacterium]|nr:dockerin type I domain-containing protein [Phycisphaerales bacterium]
MYGKIVSSNINAWVWLPEADAAYPSLSVGFNNLSSISGSGNGIAYDLNNAGVVVGRDGDDDDNGSQAIAWKLTTSGAPATNLGFLSNGAWSVAHAINNNSTPLIVGTSDTTGSCICGGGGTGHVTRGFQIAFSSPLGSMTVLGANFLTHSSRDERDIMTDNGGVIRSVGMWTCNQTDPCDDWNPGDCDDSHAAVRSGNTEYLDLGDGSEARGINDSYLAVGWGFDGADCTDRRALLWPMAGFTNTILGDTMPSGQSGQNSRAEAINNHASTQVVGWNSDLALALLWEKPSSTWTVTDLNAYGFPSYVIPQCSADTWNINQAHDINDCGWIVAWGTKVSNSAKHALLLVPFGECRWDVNQDGAVNTTDYNYVTDPSRQGSCPSGSICWADVNDDCQVNSTDATQVASHFGTCGDTGCDGGGSQSFMGGGDPPVAAPMDEELMGFWLESGGHDAIVNGEVSDEQIIAALQEESDEAKLIALFALLAQ